MPAGLLPIIYLAFISLGLPDSAIGSAWPTMAPSLGAGISWVGVVTMIISAGTIVSSLMSVRVVERFGTGRVTVASVALTAAALVGFSQSQAFWQLCLWAVPYGLGAGAVDAALNAYVAVYYESQHMSWLHCMWGVGASGGPMVMAQCLERSTWSTGFLVLGGIQVGIALVLALMVDNIKVGAKFFRTVYFFPIVISATALGLLFNLIFLYDGGMLNQLLQNLGLAAENIDWKDPAHFFVTMMVPVIWQYVGFYFVILVTGLNNISTDIYEAAEIDGASGLGRIRYITLPLLHNTLCTCLVLAITGSLKVFDLPWTMFVGGLPLDKSWLTGTYMYYQTMVLQDVDYGSAIAILIVVLGVVISQIANRIFKEKDY